ncbi:cytochrome c oxidase subunit 3 [Novosphingobium colocasiae]|uniref:Cytochrome c oxidase subunit III n=1 Tax=Novosphingobium colocasiae TaxID=1256513 RepID=A0A918UCV0_9SPHN|nr:cytochrome c oxidase subunit 3 [Novosphingobium colocasiae]GGY90532.1 cytochrome c oxidase subunit III [Novosphingobium colocasiae]
MHSSLDAHQRALDRQPGTNGPWTFVFIDMIVFSMIFMVFLSERARLPDVFAAAQAGLPFGFGMANTLVLLTSSLFMVEAVHAAAKAPAAVDVARIRRNLALCVACSVAFGINKIIEYSHKIAEGHGPATNSFYSFYFFMTGVHFLHVLGGTGFILHCFARAREQAGSEAYRRKIENVGLFWHFVDLLWLFIFPLIYLTGGHAHG